MKNSSSKELLDIEKLRDKASEYLKEEKQAERLKMLDKQEEESIKPLTEIYGEIPPENRVKEKKKNSIPWRNYLIYLVILTSLTCCFTFSKYITEVVGNSISSVAKFDVNVTGDLSVSPATNDVMLSGFLGNKPQTYIFKVTNNSEVTVDVNITTTGSETNHTMTLTPSVFTLAANEEKEVTVSITKKDGASNGSTDSVSINISVTQDD